MSDDKIRLGGMALVNGVLVHGPTSWACAVRTSDGRLKVVAERKRVVGSSLRTPLLRGPARLVESFAFLPRVKRALPEAVFPFEGRRMVGTLIATAAATQVVRRVKLTHSARELVTAMLSLAPAVLSLREGALAAYHGAEHIAIGTYEHDEPRAREHERCGTHLVGPLLVTTAVGNVVASRAPVRYRSAARIGAAVGAVAASTEIFSWMQRHPEAPLARALAKPGHEFQHRVATAEPTPDQLEVAEAALAACLELERQ
jgi:uncharacterized protein YqhQ